MKSNNEQEIFFQTTQLFELFLSEGSRTKKVLKLAAEIESKFSGLTYYNELLEKPVLSKESLARIKLVSKMLSYGGNFSDDTLLLVEVKTVLEN